MASASKDKSFHGLLVGLGIAGTIAGVAILFAYAASTHSYNPQGTVSDSEVQDAGQPALPSQQIDADDAASIAATDWDITDDSLQMSEESSDKSQTMQEQAPAPSKNQMPEKQQPVKPPAVTFVTKQAGQIDANTTTAPPPNNSNSQAPADNVAVTEEEPRNHSGNDNEDAIKIDRQQQVTSGGIVSIDVQIDKIISPTVQPEQEKQIEDDRTKDNSSHHDNKVKVQDNDSDKKSKQDKHEQKHGDKSGKGNKDRHEEKHGKDHKGHD